MPSLVYLFIGEGFPDNLVEDAVLFRKLMIQFLFAPTTKHLSLALCFPHLAALFWFFCLACGSLTTRLPRTEATIPPICPSCALPAASVQIL
jgi:hypothetical protein